MTMIPPKIKGLPNLRNKTQGYLTKPQQGSTHSNRGLYNGGRMVR